MIYIILCAFFWLVYYNVFRPHVKYFIEENRRVLIKTDPEEIRLIEEEKNNNIMLTQIEVQRFISDEKNIDKIVNIINGESIINPYFLTWVINETDAQYPIETDNDIIYHNLNEEYRYLVKYIGTDLFTPLILRCNTIPLGDSGYYSSLGQLNFLKWIIEGNIVEHLETYIERYKSSFCYEYKYEYQKN
tara:strand:- start:5660 stop:6226 length:567 start_codon:yes stop_codon:yes gene_type:complete